MSDEPKQEAAAAAKQAAGQGKAAARNTARAVRAASEPVREAAQDGARAVASEAEEIKEKAQGTAHDAARAARRLDTRILSRMSSDTGVGFLALSVSIYSGTLAFYKFRSAFVGRKQVLGS